MSRVGAFTFWNISKPYFDFFLRSSDHSLSARAPLLAVESGWSHDLTAAAKRDLESILKIRKTRYVLGFSITRSSLFTSYELRYLYISNLPHESPISRSHESKSHAENFLRPSAGTLRTSKLRPRRGPQFPSPLVKNDSSQTNLTSTSRRTVLLQKTSFVASVRPNVPQCCRLPSLACLPRKN